MQQVELAKRIYLDIQEERKGCLMDYSTATLLTQKAHFNNFGVRYVATGREVYTVNGRKYELNGGQYLLANQHADGHILIESKGATRGICIDIAHDLLSEVTASYLRPDTTEVDLALDQFFYSASFLENQYSSEQMRVGNFLQTLDQKLLLSAHDIGAINIEFYYKVAECILLDHIPIFKELQKIGTVKYDTRNELYRRAARGKKYMDDCFRQPISIPHIAKEAQLSEYHFYRIYKQIYDISPHQYLISKRLAYAYEMLQKGWVSISELAVDAGFADLPSFSKAFRKVYGLAPSHFAKSR